MALPFPKAVTLLPGSAWCRSKCRRVIGRSLAASLSAATAICACCSSRALVAFCSDPGKLGEAYFGPWLTAAAKRLHRNVLAVALANKLARIAWTVLAQRRDCKSRVIVDAA